MTTDTLRVEKLSPRIDGSYEFNLVNMLSLGHEEAFTMREAHEIKRLTGIRVGEMTEALAAGDSDMMVALALTVLRRNGKRVEEDLLWDSPIGAGVQFDFKTLEEALLPEEDEESPPAQPPATAE